MKHTLILKVNRKVKDSEEFGELLYKKVKECIDFYKLNFIGDIYIDIGQNFTDVLNDRLTLRIKFNSKSIVSPDFINPN